MRFVSLKSLVPVCLKPNNGYCDVTLNSSILAGAKILYFRKYSEIMLGSFKKKIAVNLKSLLPHHNVKRMIKFIA